MKLGVSTWTDELGGAFDFHGALSVGGAEFSSSDDGNIQLSWSVIIDDLLRMRNLEDNWDGEGTPAPDPAIVDHAIALAQWLQRANDAPASRVIAGVNGTVYFEWHTADGYKEIEVTTPRDAEIRWLARGSKETAERRLSRQS